MIVFFRDVSKKKPEYKNFIQGLREFLIKEEPELAKETKKFLREQESKIPFETIVKCIVLREMLGDKTFLTSKKDYEKFIQTKLNMEWKKSMTAGAKTIENNCQRFSFDIKYALTEKWLKRHGAEFVNEISNAQRRTLNELIVRAAKTNIAPDVLAKQIRPVIGLTRGQAIANQNYFFKRYEKLMKIKPNAGVAEVSKLLADTRNYSEKQLDRRAMTIARTELARGYHAGEYYGIKQAQSQGLIGRVIKKISTAGDKRVCEKCQNMDGKETEMNGRFQYGKEDIENDKSSLNEKDGELFPPFHPCCRCEVLYIECEDSRTAGNPNAMNAPQESEEIVAPDFIPIKGRENISDDVLEQINSEIALLPESHKRIIENEVNEIRIDADGNSRYDRKKGVLYLARELEEGELIHELGHAIETSLDLYHNERFLVVLRIGLSEVTPWDIIDDYKNFDKPIKRLENHKFISMYQGRIYIHDIDGNGYIIGNKFNGKCLGDYFSEGYREYFFNPQNLKSKDRELYDFIEGL